MGLWFSHCQQPEILNGERRTGGLKEAISLEVARHAVPGSTSATILANMTSLLQLTDTIRHIDKGAFS